MKTVKVVLLAIIFIFLLLSLFQNYNALLTTTTLELNLFGPLQLRSTPIPLYVLILGSLFLGVLVTAFYFGMGSFRSRRKLRSLRKQNYTLQEELNSLRNLPITDAEVTTNRSEHLAGSESTEEPGEANSGKAT
jgi:uncharacterized integral membrane protein